MFMNSYLMIGIPILIILLIIAYIVLYNRLNRLRIKVEEAGADIDVALEKRFDLLSEEIEAVKKYLSHEYRIMTDLTAARVSAGLEEKRMAQQQEISEEVLKSIDQEIARQTRTMEQIAPDFPYLQIAREYEAAGTGCGKRTPPVTPAVRKLWPKRRNGAAPLSAKR